MRFKLDLPILPSSFKINYNEKLFFVGSCFSENIGNYLQQNAFDVTINPFGILYHPLAIFKSIERIIKLEYVQEADLVYNQNLWHSWAHHGRFSHPNQSTALKIMNDEIQQAHSKLQSANYLFLTFGTSIVYEWIEQDRIVANCHKMPNQQFRKYFLDLETIQDAFEQFFTNLKAFNPTIKIICTISPVRHWRDGLVENNKSKSSLIYLVHQWIEKFSDVFYFPAYELILDDLRDYRYYEKDLCHPNQLGIDYVIDYFKSMYFDDKTIEFANAIERYLKLKNHRVQFNVDEHLAKIDTMKHNIENDFGIQLM